MKHNTINQSFHSGSFGNRKDRASRFDSIRRVIGVILLLVATVFALSSCDKTLDAPAPAPLETGDLTASAESVAIDAANPTAEAVTLSWTAFANSRVAYKMLLTSGSTSDTITIPQNASSKRFSMAELNSIAVDNLGLPIDVPADIDFKLLANVTINANTAESNVVRVSVTPAPTGPAYTDLWIVGDATPNGWDINNPNKMIPDPTNNFQFKFGVTGGGEFKIPTTTGNWGTDYFMPPTNNPDITSTAVQFTPGGNPDNKWKIPAGAAYKVLLNISTSPFINITPFTPSTTMYMVGNATPAGWNIDGPTPMTMTPGNPYEFTYTGPLTEGQFKIPLATGNWDGAYYMPAQDDAAPGTMGVRYAPTGQPDYKWKISEAGTYKVTLNQLMETITIVKQ